MPDFTNDKINGAEFEASVRHVERQLYNQASSTGSIKIDDRERDEIIDTGTELIIVVIGRKGLRPVKQRPGCEGADTCTPTICDSS